MMTKTPVPLRVNDMTVFTRSLSQQLGETSPSHLKLMNIVARAAGFQNVQHMRAASAAARRLDDVPSDIIVDARVVERTLHQFDQVGKLLRWPSKRSVQTLALWALWATLPSNTSLSERTVNDIFDEEHHFKDSATLRRTMISCGMLTRQVDGTDYRRVEQKPPAEAKAIIRELSARRDTRATTKTETQDA
ncbi:MAG: DUF2087 domain-containing protein [Aliishimia sp.]